MESWLNFNNEEFQRLGKLSRYVYALLLRETVDKMLQERCGFTNDQSNHMSVNPKPHLDPFILLIYAEALWSVDRTEVEEICRVSKEILQWKDASTHPHQDYIIHLKSLIKSWYITDFQTVDENLSVEKSISEAVVKARCQLNA